jgi:hypothetical protein
VAIDDSGEWWVGSDAADIEPYLRALTESDGSYPVSVFRGISCGCGSDAFHLERAGEVTRRQCANCGSQRLICRITEDWEEATQEDGVEPYSCVGCGGHQANLGMGFATYDEAPDMDAVRWFYVGVRCMGCGILACFNQGKVGHGPAAEVYEQA